jgi:hypothetical protein
MSTDDERPGGISIELSPFLAGACALVVAIVLAYSNSLQSPFVFDDHPNIVRNPIVHDLGLFAAPWRVDASLAPGTLVYGLRSRYLAFLTFAVNYRIHGTRVFGYHLVNVAIHVAAALVLFAATRRLLGLASLDASRVRGHESGIALLVAALFALHPLQTQAVTYVVQRMTSLAGLLCLVAFWSYLGARTAESGRKRRLCAAAYGLALVAAFFTKQNVVTFPLILVLVEIFLVGSKGGERVRRLAIPIVLLVALPLAGQSTLRAGTSDAKAIDATLHAPDIGVREYVLTQIPVLVTYLRLTVLPIRQNLDHDYPASRSLFEPKVVACGALLCLLFALGVWLLARRGTRDPAWRLVGLGILWFFVMHVVESSGVGRLDFLFEHRMYLPSVGLFLAAVVAVVVGLPPRRLPLAFAAGTAAVLVLGAATWVRNQVWRDDVRLYRDVAAKSPRKPRALLSLGESLLEKKRVTEAEAAFVRAFELDPRKVETLVNLGVVARIKREPEKAESYFREALTVVANHWVALVNLGDLVLERGDRAAAERYYRRAAEYEQLSTIARGRLERLQAAQSPRVSFAVSPPTAATNNR